MSNARGDEEDRKPTGEPRGTPRRNSTVRSYGPHFSDRAVLTLRGKAGLRRNNLRDCPGENSTHEPSGKVCVVCWRVGANHDGWRCLPYRQPRACLQRWTLGTGKETRSAIDRMSLLVQPTKKSVPIHASAVSGHFDSSCGLAENYSSRVNPTRNVTW
jgi:hypothetical protein